MNVTELQDRLRNPLYVLNQIHALKRNLRSLHPDVLRPLGRIEEHLANNLHIPGVLPDGCGLVVDDPLGQPYDERRTDLDAEVIGQSGEALFVLEVFKPIIRFREGGGTTIVQQASVMVGPKNQQGEAS